MPIKFLYISDFDWKFYVFKIKLFGKIFINLSDYWWLTILFGSAHGWDGGGGVGKEPSLPKIFNAYPIVLKLGIVTFLKKTHQKKYESRDTSFEMY